MLAMAVCLGLANSAAAAREDASLLSRLDTSLRLGAQYRYFFHDALQPRQHRADASLAAQAGAELQWDHRDQGFTLTLFGRADQHDAARTHADIREAFYRYTGRNIEWRIGIRKVFWGVTESEHLVDIINQTDFVESIKGEDKLGQPMVNLAWFTGAGTLNFYVLPYFRERTFPNADGRPRPLLPIDDDNARFTSGAGKSHLDFALRYTNTFGPLDLGLSYFRGTNRNPRYDFGFDACTATVTFKPLLFGVLTPPPVATSCAAAEQASPPPLVTVDQVRVDVDNPVFVPVYEQIDQGGLSLQYLLGGLALKAEAIYRRSDTQHFTATASGFEYTFYGVFGSGVDVGLLGEYLWDQRGNIDKDVARAADQLSRGGTLTFNSVAEARGFQNSLRRQSAAAFQNDVFIGTRLAFNDLRGSEIRAGVIRDLDTDALLGTLQASRRLGGGFKLTLSGRLFSQIPVTDPLYGFRDDDDVTLTLQYFF